MPVPTLTRRAFALASLALVISAPASLAASPQELRDAIVDGPARNVILLIGDGMSDPEITMARNYLVGAAGRLALDELPLTGQMTTYSVREDDPTKPDYDPESASTATAWSTGTKTSDGRISTAPGTDEDLVTTLELAQAAGLRVGNVTTADVTDATPAAPMSHVRLRACAGPADMEDCPQDLKSAGGPGSIAEQAIDHRLDVLLGGGLARFEQPIPEDEPGAGSTLRSRAEADGFQVVTDLASLQAAQPGSPVLGLFTDSHMTPDWGGEDAARTPTGPQTCTQGEQPATEPTLADMTTAAIELLAATGAAASDAPGSAAPEHGFFLQVEGASVDKRAHASQPCQQIGEMADFDAAVRVALDFARADGETLVIVTGDHAHTAQIVEADAEPAGFSSTLTTGEGEPMMITYGTALGAAASEVSQEHTGSQIRVAAEGPGGAAVVGLIDQTDLFDIVSEALALGS